MAFKVTPRRVILGLLQVAPKESISIRSLITVGELFGFSDNTIRVTVLRLLRKGTIDSDARGEYRIRHTSPAISRFINGWRLGESRTVPWDGGWIGCFFPKNQNRHKTKNQKVLNLLGFKEGMPKFWVRPNNLSMEFNDLKTVLFHFGLDEKAELFTAHRFSEDLIEKWQQFLWPIRKIRKRQFDLEEKLKESVRRIETLPSDNALVETFLLGSQAIHMLLTDPLLPSQIMPNNSRLALTRTMLEYDAAGKEVWRGRFGGFRLDNTPHHHLFNL